MSHMPRRRCPGGGSRQPTIPTTALGGRQTQTDCKQLPSPKRCNLLHPQRINLPQKQAAPSDKKHKDLYLVEGGPMSWMNFLTVRVFSPMSCAKVASASGFVSS